jgi:hypothetical protein
MSRLALASAMPESPPMVKRAIKPKLKINGVVNRMEPPKTVANQENILIPVGHLIWEKDCSGFEVIVSLEPRSVGELARKNQTTV